MRRVADELVLFVLGLTLYVVTDYGGIRAADSEVVFRTAESLESDGTFAIPHELELWAGFGMAKGRDGRLYSVFGPLQSVLEAPLVGLARHINQSRWYERDPWAKYIPISHYYDEGLADAIRLQRPADLGPHALRFIVSFLNPLITAIGVLVFHLLLLRLGIRRFPAFATSLLYAFGTLTWPYSGTCFSEPIAILFVLLSLLLLVSSSPEIGSPTESSGWRRAVGGLSLGLAICAHISALLFAPFFIFYAFVQAGGLRRRRASTLAVVYNVAGLGVVLVLLGYYNYARFGNILETGRWANPAQARLFSYAELTWPARGLYGLLASPGRGLVWYCPATLIGVATYGCFWRAHRALAATIAVAVVARVLIMGSLTDWPGGFSVGPRYLIMTGPFLVIPIAFWLQDRMRAGRARALQLAAAGGAALVIQQLYFALGEIFLYFHILKLSAEKSGIDILAGNMVYFDWSLSPLLNLLRAPRAPFLLTRIHASNLAVWLCGSVVVVIILGLALIAAYRLTGPGVTARTDNGGGPRRRARRAGTA